MLHKCGRCSRINPAEAAYCYHDGNLLGKHPHPTAADLGTHIPFHAPFVFPNGRVARNFNELALGCQADWETARELLAEGKLESFLSALDRADLAQGAREAASYPDIDRGLDQFLARLPSQVLEGPKIQVNPSDISLGVVHVNDKRQFEISLANQGMRMVYGSVNCEECPWLSLSDSPSCRDKHFQFQAEMTLPVHLQGKYLRAGNQPMEGRLNIESNGGMATVVVRVEVPVQPFAEGVLAGAKSPRQLAEKAKASPREAAHYFENGQVARWYEANGWTYPITGPTAKRLAAIQQYFEALGLTPAPKVEIREPDVVLQGRPGAKLRTVLEVYSQERRPIYAHATSDRDWLIPGHPRQKGSSVTISLKVPNVPDRPGETLTATVIVKANGHQKFYVPVTLHIRRHLESASRNGEAQEEDDSPRLLGWSWLRRLWKR
jgi:hypothetical protein